jgi:hypothetical protein
LPCPYQEAWNFFISSFSPLVNKISDSALTEAAPQSQKSKGKSQKAKVKKIKAHLSQAPKFIYGRRKKYPVGEHRSGVEPLGRQEFQAP